MRLEAENNPAPLYWPPFDGWIYSVAGPVSKRVKIIVRAMLEERRIHGRELRKITTPEGDYVLVYKKGDKRHEPSVPIPNLEALVRERDRARAEAKLAREVGT